MLDQRTRIALPFAVLTAILAVSTASIFIRFAQADAPSLVIAALRLTCATLLLKQGVNPKFVQELLGHADISLTLNVYSHVLPDMGDAASGAMDAALG